MSGASPRYESFSSLKRTFSVSSATLRPAGAGRRLYDVSSVERHLGCSAAASQDLKAEKTCIIYARVSSAHKKEDLRR